MNEKINELYNKLDAQDEIIEQQIEVINKLRKQKQKAIEYIKENAHYDFYNLDIAVDGKKLLEILGDKEQDIEFDVLKALNTDLDDDVEMG